MAAEIVRRIWDHFDRNREPALYADREAFETRRLDPRIEELLTLASVTTGDDSREYSIQAAIEAEGIFHIVSERSLTSQERVLRGRYAEVAVTSYLSAGEIENASRFGGVAIQDPLLPQVSKERIQKALEIAA